MASSAISTVIVAFTVVVLLILINALRKTVARGEWSGTAVLGAVTVCLTISFVELFVTHLGMWRKQQDPYKNVHWVVPASAHQVMRGLTLLLGVLAVILLIVRLRRPDTVINLPAVLFLLVGVVSAGSAALHGDNPFRPLSVVFLAVVLASTVAPRGLGIHIGVGAACMITAIASGLTFAAHRDFSVFACTTDTFTTEKCGILGFNFRGILENENALAIYLALAMPFVFIGFGWWEGPVLAAYLLGLILITGSRSGTTAGVITFLALIILRPNIRRPAAAPIRSGLLYFGLATTVAAGFFLPFSATDPTKYHGRASLWMMARDALSDPATLLYGTGMKGWQHMREKGLIDFNAAYSVHNLWLQVLFSAGLIGLLLFLLALAILLSQARPNYSLVAGCVLVPVFVLAVTEQPWPIDTGDWLTWAVPAALLSYPVVRGRSTQRDVEANKQQQLSPFETAAGTPLEYGD